MATEIVEGADDEETATGEDDSDNEEELSSASC